MLLMIISLHACFLLVAIHPRSSRSAISIVSSIAESRIDFNSDKHAMSSRLPQHLHAAANFHRASPKMPGAYLYAKLMSGYNTNVLPVNRTHDSVSVRVRLKLVQLSDIDEKNQVMTTSVWLRHEWKDSNLVWNPKDHAGIEMLNIPANEIWLPDTVLYNNADGDYQITIHTKATVRYDGLVVWEPPAIYKSFCLIQVKYFPFDAQLCELKFGPWTFDVSKVDYRLVSPNGTISDYEDLGVDLSTFSESVEWDILKISGKRNVFQYPCCEETYVDITYSFHIRRKTLFYTINLIIPCVSISFLTVMVFYLPSESGEKVALSISILISLTVFILLLSEIVPPTSLALPLMGKYLLFTMVMVTFSVIISVAILYIHFRHPYAYEMHPLVRRIFLQIIPKFLFFELQTSSTTCPVSSSSSSSSTKLKTSMTTTTKKQSCLRTLLQMLRNDDGSKHKIDPTSGREGGTALADSLEETSDGGSGRGGYIKRNKAFNDGDDTGEESMISSQEWQRRVDAKSRYDRLLFFRDEAAFLKEATPFLEQYLGLPEVRDGMMCIQFISQRYRDSMAEKQMKSDWEALARVLDRIFLLIFSFMCVFCTMAILLQAPALYDTTQPLDVSTLEEITVFETHYEDHHDYIEKV